jgi:DNA helicase-2/ATP-dependent DNA helicase PcrA
VDDVRGTSRKVACITYTNAGVHEIDERLRHYGNSCDQGYFETGTIHSFCLNNILRPYLCHVPELALGFDVTTADDEWFQNTVAELSDEYGIPAWATGRFDGVLREPDGSMVVPAGISDAAAEEFLGLLESARRVTLGGIVYYSALIVRKCGFVSRGLSSRFAWYLIDEFQDTSAAQVEILSAIHAAGRSQFFLVGDPNQSIYGFGGAHPELMGRFSNAIRAKEDITLYGNYRCSQHIVDLAEKVCPTVPSMKAVGQTKDYDLTPKHVHCGTILEGVWEYFLPGLDERGIDVGEAAVLAPQWPQLYHLARALRVRGVPVIGPGARPYRRSHEFASFAEAACSYLKHGDAAAAVAVHRSLFTTLLNVSGLPDGRVYTYFGKRILFRLLREFKRLLAEEERATLWIEASADAMATIVAEADLLSEEHAKVLISSANGMVADIRRNVADPENLSALELGIFARPDKCLQLLTMHRAKGREFDAVAIVDLHDDKVPHFSSHDVPGEIEEARRLVYVGATRARKVLMFFTDKSDRRNVPSRFLAANCMGFVN